MSNKIMSRKTRRGAACLIVRGAAFCVCAVALALLGCEEDGTTAPPDVTPPDDPPRVTPPDDPPDDPPDAMPPDVTAPAVISLTAAPGSTNDSIALTWSEPADSDFSHILLYWTPAGGDQQQPLRVNKGTETQTIRGFATGVYSFFAASVDVLGNVSVASARSDGSVDVVPPAAVSLNAAPTENGGAEIRWSDPGGNDFSHILLSWTPEEGDQTQPHRVHRGVERAGITGLTNGADYVFTAVSVDSRMNQSRASTAPTVTADATAPAAVTDLTANAGVGVATLTWVDPADSDFSHTLVTWSPAGGDQAQPLRVEPTVRRASLTGLTNETSYALTVTSYDAAGNGTAATATATPTAMTTTINSATASTLTPAGSSTLTWIDPAVTAGIAKLKVTGMPGPTTAVEVELGVGTVTLTGLTATADHTFTITTVDSAGAATETGVSVSANGVLSRPVALFSLGAQNGAFGFAACENFRATDTGVVATELRAAGYSEAVFFGSARVSSTNNYHFRDIATNGNALGVAGASAVQLEGRGVVVYTSATPITTFGASQTTRSIGSVLNVNISSGGFWLNNGYDVVGRVGGGDFWSFTGSNGAYFLPASCSGATIGNNSGQGATGSARGIVGTRTIACNTRNLVFCAAH